MGQKEWYKSKTVWFNGIVIVLGILDQLAKTEVLKDYSAQIIEAVSVGNFVLRFFTDKSIKS